jgi:hypothetical protein
LLCHRTTFVEISVYVQELLVIMSLVGLPTPFVLGPVLSVLHAVAVSVHIDPLPVIDCASLVSVSKSVLPFMAEVDLLSVLQVRQQTSSYTAGLQQGEKAFRTL